MKDNWQRTKREIQNFPAKQLFSDLIPLKQFIIALRMTIVMSLCCPSPADLLHLFLWWGPWLMVLTCNVVIWNHVSNSMKGFDNSGDRNSCSLIYFNNSSSTGCPKEFPPGQSVLLSFHSIPITALEISSDLGGNLVRHTCLQYCLSDRNWMLTWS